MRYQSDEQDRLFKIYEPFLKVDSNREYYLPDTAPQEAKEAYEKVQKMIFDREMKESGFF